MANGVPNDVEQGEQPRSWEAQLGKRILQFFLAVALIIIGMFLASMSVFDEIILHHKILWPIWGVSSIITILAAFILLALLMCTEHFHHGPLTWLIFLTGLALTASYCSLLFLVKMNATIAIIIPAQKLIVVGVITYMGTRNAGAHDDNLDRTRNAGAHADNLDHRIFESEMDCSFDLSKLSNAAAFTVQTFLIKSYLTSSSNSSEAPGAAPGSDHAGAAFPCGLGTSRADLAITCFGSTLCLCSMMITCMPLRFSMKGAKGLLATVKILKYAMLVALAWIATTLAAGLLDEMVALSFTPLLVASAFFVFWEFQGTVRETQRADRFGKIIEYKNICIGSMAVAYYTILVNVYSTDPGTETEKSYVKLFVLLLLAAIISGLALTPFAMKPEISPPQRSEVSPPQTSEVSPPQSPPQSSEVSPPQSSEGSSEGTPPQSSKGTPQPGYENSLAVARIMVSFAGLLVLIVGVIVVYVCIKLY